MRLLTLDSYNENYIQINEVNDILCDVTVKNKEIYITSYRGDIELINNTFHKVFKVKEKITYEDNEINMICYEGIFNYNYVKLCILPDLNVMFIYSNLNPNSEIFNDVSIYELIKK
jgi:hypothetical protein